MSRGALTEEVQEVAKEKLGRVISQTELRLMPYVWDCLMNSKNLKREHINEEDRNILRDWKISEWIFDPTSNLQVSSDFYDSISAICKISYCSGYIR